MADSPLLDAIRDIDPKSLLKAYERRQKEFTKDIQPGQHEIIVRLLAEATVFTRISYEIWFDYLKSLVEYAHKREVDALDDAENSKQQAAKLLAESSALLVATKNYKQKGIDETSSRLLAARVGFLGTNLEGADALQRLNTTTYDALGAAAAISCRWTYVSLYALYDTTDLAAVRDTVTIALKNAAGAIPIPIVNTVATIGITLWDIGEAAKARAQVRGKASKVLAALDSYLDAAYGWCVQTELSIAWFQGTLQDYLVTTSTDGSDQALPNVDVSKIADKVNSRVLTFVADAASKGDAP